MPQKLRFNQSYEIPRNRIKTVSPGVLPRTYFSLHWKIVPYNPVANQI